MSTELETRAEDGTFLPGKSGNPAGRPQGTKNRIAQMKRDMEAAIREHMDPAVIGPIVQAMVTEALLGNVSAAKLILDKVMSNAKVEEDTGETKRTIKIYIENLTSNKLKEVTGETYDQEEDTDGS